jgi:hypothetical protein
MLVGASSHDSARGQTSVAPPISIVPPNASPPHAGAKNSRNPPAASGRETSTSVPGVTAPAPNPAADYDGFSATDDNDTPSQVTPSRAAMGAKSNLDAAGQSPIDQEDEALRRKLTICKNCK